MGNWIFSHSDDDDDYDDDNDYDDDGQNNDREEDDAVAHLWDGVAEARVLQREFVRASNRAATAAAAHERQITKLVADEKMAPDDPRVLNLARAGVWFKNEAAVAAERAERVGLFIEMLKSAIRNNVVPEGLVKLVENHFVEE